MKCTQLYKVEKLAQKTNDIHMYSNNGNSFTLLNFTSVFVHTYKTWCVMAKEKH